MLFLCLSLASALITIPIKYNHDYHEPLREYLRSYKQKTLKTLPVTKLTNNRNVTSKQSEYSALFLVGTPSQELNLVIDTSSSFIWFQEPGCFPCHECKNSFDVGASATYENLHEKTTIIYNTGNVTGALGLDNFTLSEESDLFVLQEFVVASSDFGFETSTADGVVGFGFGLLSNNISTWLQTLNAEGKLGNTVFSLYLNDNQYNNNIQPLPESALILGGFDTDYALSHDSVIVNIDIDNSTGYWQMSLNSLKIGLETVPIKSNKAIIDSGNGYISASSEDAKLIREWFFEKYDPCNENADGFIVCECPDLREFPSFTILIGRNEEFSLPPSAYFLRENEVCLLLINEDNYLTNTWRLGSPFLRKWYSIYDMTNLQVSLYPAKISHDPSQDPDPSTKWIIVFFVVLLIVISIVLSVFLYLFCCRQKMNFEDTYKPSFTAKYSLPPHYHRTAVRNASSGEIVQDVIPTSRQNRVFPGISKK